MRKNVEVVLFWGALWGLEEATLGYLLHLLPINIGWLFWFPLAFAFMQLSYRKTGRVSSMLYTSFIAAAIKLIDLLLPTRIDKIINPAAAILLEGAAVFGMFFLAQKRPFLKRFTLVKVFLACMLQSFLYITYITIVPLFTTAIPAVNGLMGYVTYLWHALVNATVLCLFVRFCLPLVNKLPKPELPPLHALRQKKTPAILSAASPYLLLMITVYLQLVL